MQPQDWIRGCPVSITVCDRTGNILEMNDKAGDVFASDGGKLLIGQNVLDCHPEPSRTKLAGMLASGQSNIYTIEKGGKKKLICQAPWYQGGEFAGLVELAIEIPWEMPHFVRDKAPARQES